MRLKDRTLKMWVIYDHPLDFPESFVVREWNVGRSKLTPVEAPTGLAPTIEAVRAMLPEGLYRMDRWPDDDPKIVEVWF